MKIIRKKQLQKNETTNKHELKIKKKILTKYNSFDFERIIYDKVNKKKVSVS